MTEVPLDYSAAGAYDGYEDRLVDYSAPLAPYDVMNRTLCIRIGYQSTATVRHLFAFNLSARGGIALFQGLIET